MPCIDVQWLHDLPDEPVRLVSELDDACHELRKLEFFADGRIGFASQEMCSGGTQLGQVPVPPLEQINADSAFRGRYIEPSEFEALWRAFGSPAA